MASFEGPGHALGGAADVRAPPLRPGPTAAGGRPVGKAWGKAGFFFSLDCKCCADQRLKPIKGGRETGQQASFDKAGWQFDFWQFLRHNSSELWRKP